MLVLQSVTEPFIQKNEPHHFPIASSLPVTVTSLNGKWMEGDTLFMFNVEMRGEIAERNPFNTMMLALMAHHNWLVLNS